MKKITFLIFVLIHTLGFTQDHDHEHERMIEAEMKSASGIINMSVNPNTQNYDITYHKLEFTVNPAVYSITGKVTTTFTALSNMNTVTFDFYKTTTSPFAISSIKKDGVDLVFSHNATHELVITLPAMLTNGSSATVEINYSGSPSTAESAFTTSTHGPTNTPVLYTLSEPFGARDWWPCKQDLNDKANNIDVYITAPSAYVSVSNGIQQSEIVNGANKTTHFSHGYPIAAYLIAIAVTNYQIHNQQGGLGTVGSPFFPIVNYIYPENSATTITSLAVTPQIINTFESLIGNYPFRNEKYGHAQFGWGGGMEHTTVSFMGSWGRDLISHEMAHQWFGDKITCGTWKDIWLNEGITEYMSGLIVENLDVPTNPNAFINWKAAKITNITSQPTGNLYLTDAQALDVNRIFSPRITYNKGSMVSNMLRFKMGDANFFNGLKSYLADPMYAYAYALTPQFRTKMESFYGAPDSLLEFFNDWVYNQGYPTYTINASNGSNTSQVTIQINQTQSDLSVSFFEMPLPIRLTGASGEISDVVLENTTNGQIFVVNAPFPVTGIIFDPNKNIISRNNTVTLGTPNFDYSAAITMFPNPGSEEIAIQLPENVLLEKVTFYNNLGLEALQSNTLKINISTLSSGIYIVALETEKGIFYKKFIKK